MTREEAKREAQRLAQEHPDRETHQWQTREAADGTWDVIKIGVPPPAPVGDAETRADEKPPTPDDPRTAFGRDVPYGSL